MEAPASQTLPEQRAQALSLLLLSVVHPAVDLKNMRLDYVDWRPERLCVLGKAPR